jgi:hypothetical protein
MNNAVCRTAQFAALPLYLSPWVYVSLPPAFLVTRCELYGHAKAKAGTFLASLIIFSFWPAAVPASGIDWPASTEVDFLSEPSDYKPSWFVAAARCLPGRPDDLCPGAAA